MLNEHFSKLGEVNGTFPSVNECFIKACLAIVTTAYKKMKAEKRFDLKNDEPQLTAILIGHMIEVRNENPNCALRISPEQPEYDEKILRGIKHPKTAPIIDIKIFGAWVEEDQYYGLEAKILVEKKWETRRPSYLHKRYIETGIDNFVKGNYSRKMNTGCIVGYVIQGNTSNIVSKINFRLINSSRTSEQLVGIHSINSCEYCYNSQHMRKTDKKNIRP